MNEVVDNDRVISGGGKTNQKKKKRKPTKKDKRIVKRRSRKEVQHIHSYKVLCDWPNCKRRVGTHPVKVLRCNDDVPL